MYTVLICDDDKDIVSALEIYLTSEGYRTVSAYNGEEAIRAVNEGNIDLILMDIMMPQLDGIRATARLRESGGSRGADRSDGGGAECTGHPRLYHPALTHTRAHPHAFSRVRYLADDGGGQPDASGPDKQRLATGRQL